jgi:hypothetical protein
MVLLNYFLNYTLGRQIKVTFHSSHCSDAFGSGITTEVTVLVTARISDGGHIVDKFL